jgi:hypothetical protein
MKANQPQIDEKKLIVKDGDYIAALYFVLKHVVKVPVMINGKAMKEMSEAKNLIKVDFNAELDAYRFSIKKKQNRSIITPDKRIRTLKRKIQMP